MGTPCLECLFGGLTPDLDEWLEVDARHGVRIRLRQFKARGAPKGDIALLAGGNTGGETFLVPDGGLVRHLREDWDVWLVDWRTSPHVVGQILKGGPLGGGVEGERALFHLDEAAEKDVPLALARIRQLGRGPSLAVLGHCLGGGVTSVALARGHLRHLEITSFVLSTMGLFYEVPWDGWVKAEDFLLERLFPEAPGLRAIDPHHTEGWPPSFGNAFQRWPAVWRPGRDTDEGRMLAALTFMFGKPYHFDALHPTLRGDVLTCLFGPVHLGLYLHVGQNVRRGYAARFGAPDVIDRPRQCRQKASVQGGPSVKGDLDPTHFAGQRITLLGGSDNRLWHRDSIDLMHEWLRSYAPTGSFTKLMFPGYGIQELYWGRDAPGKVYPRIAESLE